MYVADYVLMEYGTGAIMAVPGHDERDFAFAQVYDLPIRRVVEGGEELPYTGDGPLVNSRDDFDGVHNREALEQIVSWLDREGRGHATVSYRLRDWLISRQRYWGCPIPIVKCPDVRPRARARGRAAGASCPTSRTTRRRAAPRWPRRPTGSTSPCPNCGGDAQRETDTMDTFVDSSWYFIRYTDANDDEAAWDRRVTDAWMNVDQYIGGIEHAILHLLYARFFTKALTDMDLLDSQEPFQNLFTQGMITRDGAKMSKSRGNVVSPADLVARYGADTARCYILFIGPPDQDADWSDEGVEGVHRFLGRLWRLCHEARRDDRRRRARPRRARGRRPRAAAQGAPDDREGHRRHERALRLQHGDRGDHGARQRELAPARARGRRGAALRGHDGGLARLPLRAAPRLRALRAADRAPRVGGPVARARRARCCRPRPSSSSPRSTARSATASRRRARRRARSSRSSRWPRRTCARTWTARRSAR